MRFVSVRDLRGKSAEIWKELATQREMVVTSNGRPIAILAAVGESDLEDALAAFRQGRAVNAVARLQLGSTARGADAITGGQIEAEIEAVRRRRAE